MSNTIFSAGNSAMFVCDRCRITYPYSQMRRDGQARGVMVCNDPGCWDHKTPYALPPIQPDAMVLRNPRPLVHLVAFEYRNVPVYEGGPLSISPPPSTTPYIPSLTANMNEPYIETVPNTPGVSVSPNPPDLPETDNDFVIPDE